MASDAKKRQKKLERRSTKRSEKRHALLKQRSTAIWDRVSAAAKYPVLHCLVMDAIESGGMGSVLLSRQFPDGQIAVAVFLVDSYCLGVKDAFVRIVGQIEYNERFLGKQFGLAEAHPIEPADACKLIEEAVAYARKIGFGPHTDYSRAMSLFGSIDASPSTAVYHFGHDGKPHFIAGPNDTMGRCKQIMAILEQTCGPDGYHYSLPVSRPEEVDDMFEDAPLQLP